MSDRSLETVNEELRHLRKELLGLKDGLLEEAEAPLLRDLFLFYDSLTWFQQSLIHQEMPPEVLEENFQHLIDELLEVLYRRNVVPQDTPSLFNKLKHHAVEVVSTDLQHHDFRVVRVLKTGFERGDVTLRPAQVVVSRYQQD